MIDAILLIENRIGEGTPLPQKIKIWGMFKQPWVWIKTPDGFYQPFNLKASVFQGEPVSRKEAWDLMIKARIPEHDADIALRAADEEWDSWSRLPGVVKKEAGYRWETTLRLTSAIERTKPALGEKWRHFKGSEYWIIAIATYSGTREHLGEPLVIYALKQGIQLPLSAKHTETGAIFNVGTEDRGKVIVVPALTYCENPDAWARPLSNFMGVISHPHEEESNNCYRFERCKP